MDNLITEKLVALDLDAVTKGEVIRHLAGLMKKDGRLNDEDAYIKSVFDREHEFATAMGYSVAIPHGKTDAVKTPALGFARVKTPIQWSDDETVQYIFQIAVPASAAGDYHLQVLAALSRQLIHEEFVDKLGKIKDPKDIVELVGTV